MIILYMSGSADSHEKSREEGTVIRFDCPKFYFFRVNICSDQIILKFVVLCDYQWSR